MQVSDDQLLDGIDLSLLTSGERRIDEVATATKFKGSELMNLFNQAHLTAQRARATLYARVQELELRSDALAAMIALERAPAYLREKGLIGARSPGGSEDQRQAVVAADPEYIAIRSRILALKMGVEEFTIRARSMERSFSAIKCIYSDYSLPNPNLNNAVSQREHEPESGISGGGAAKPATKSGFGKPRY
jgi:hypothetical protein